MRSEGWRRRSTTASSVTLLSLALGTKPGTTEPHARLARSALPALALLSRTLLDQQPPLSQPTDSMDGASSLVELDGTLAVLESMFPPPELVLPQGVDLPLADAAPGTLPTELRAILTLELDGDERRSLILDLIFPLAPSCSLSEPTLVLRPPTWLSHAQFRQLLDGLAPAASSSVGGHEGFIDAVLDSVDHLRQAVPDLLALAASHATALEAERLARQADSAPEAERWGPPSNVDRVWYWLPSLSTREKRNDIVQAAPGWSLTGFVLAGKPGIICLEGTERNVDGYMNWIKAVSWSDIPSFQSGSLLTRRCPFSVEGVVSSCLDHE